MTERTFRLLFGTALLVGLYFSLDFLVAGLAVLSLSQGITGWRISRIVTHLRRGRAASLDLSTHSGSTETAIGAAFTLEAEQALSLIVTAMIALGGIFFTNRLWFLPWFMGFGLLGAGLSGVCPMVLGLRWAGLK